MVQSKLIRSYEEAGKWDLYSRKKKINGDWFQDDIDIGTGIQSS